MAGAKFLMGADIPRRFSPRGAIFLRDSPGGGEYPRNIAPLLRGGRISWGGKSPVTPVLHIVLQLLMTLKQMMNIPVILHLLWKKNYCI
jgi:hypothetical protein